VLYNPGKLASRNSATDYQSQASAIASAEIGLISSATGRRQLRLQARQITQICAHRRQCLHTQSAVQNGGSVCGYHELLTSLAA
jgi:hypothetical protein